MVRQLGKGGMGTASHCVRSKDGSGGGGFLALKKVACRNAAECNAALCEAKTLQGLSHRNVVRYHNVFLHSGDGLVHACIVMEFCRSGDLAAHLMQLKEGGDRVDERRAMSWMFQLSDALVYLHSRRIVHRDLKPANVFLHLISRTDMALKVGDFGLSATLEDGKRTSRVGTPCYFAPEILCNEEYAEPVDIWGAGCIFYEMLTLDFLWERRGILGAMVRTEPLTADALPSRLSVSIRNLVAACLTFKGTRRPNARQLTEGIRALSQGNPVTFHVESAGGIDEDWAAPIKSLLNPFSGTVAKLLSLGADAALADGVRACAYMTTRSYTYSMR